MRVFLSSAVEGLRDARWSLIEKIERACDNRVTLVCYERHGRQYPTLTPEETCLALVRGCKAFIILLDQYYGTQSNTAPGISITHAELREAIKNRLIVIPVVRTQTWHEYAVWRANAGREISYAHIKEPRVFEILEDVYYAFNCHVYEHLVGDTAISEIACALNSVITVGAAGAIHHVSLAAEQRLTPAASVTISPPIRMPRFVDGQIVTADDLNSLYRALVKVAQTHGLDLAPKTSWANGQMLTPAQLNLLLGDVVHLYRHCGRIPPSWSFGHFREGQVLRAAHLNEISESLKSLV
jgi:hypothetical protein